MRVLSSPPVVTTAEQVARAILDTYSAPNRTFPELREMISQGVVVDPLRQFAEVCREDLQTLEPLRPLRHRGAERLLRSRGAADAPNLTA